MTYVLDLAAGIVGGLVLAVVISRVAFWFATTHAGAWWGRLCTPKKVRDRW